MDYDLVIAEAKRFEQEDPEAGPNTCLRLAAIEAIVRDERISPTKILFRVNQIFESRGWEIHHLIRKMAA